MPHGDRPVIAYMNHSAWWDAIVPVHLSHDLFRRDMHALMEAKQLRKYPFFRHLGFFGGDAGERGEARAVSEYAEKVLGGSPRSILWICPQGALFPSHVPLRFKSGLARIAVTSPHAVIVPVALRYQFLRERKPDCWVRIGEPVARAEENIPALTRRLEVHLQREMDLLDNDIFREAATPA